MRSFLFTIFLAVAVSVGFLANSNVLAKPHGITEIHLEDLKHPYLFFTEKEIEKIKELVKVEGTYQQKRFEQIKQNADKWFTNPIVIPTRGGEGSLFYHCADDGTELLYDSDKPNDHKCPKCGNVFHGDKYGGWWRVVSHNRISVAVSDLAFVYAITGDVKYAREAGRILVKYADMYPEMPLFSLSRVGREPLDEARITFSFATAYDLIYNSAVLSEQQKKHIENDLFREVAAVMTISNGALFPDCIMGGSTNFQSHMNAATGVIGFLLRDRPLVEFAINGPVGFNYQMEKGILDNGMWLEGSIPYHNFVLTWQTYLTEAAWRSGINLYKNKKVASMYNLPFQLAFPDGSLPLTNDCPYWYLADPNHAKILAEIYFARTGDPKVEPYLTPGKITGFRIQPTPRNPNGFSSPVDLALNITPTWQKAEASTASVNSAPSFGLLRTDKKEEPIYLLMDYGPHGGTHGHPDTLNIILWANGREQAPDLNTCYYDFPQWAGWYKQTISHNTVVTDGKSLYPGAGRINMFKVSPRAKIMDGSIVTDQLSDEMDFSTKRGITVYQYPVPRTRRTIVLLDESFILDIFRVSQGVTFDWAYRNFGVFHTDENLTAQAEPLGKDNGYQYLTNVRRGKSSSDTWTATWTEDGQGVKLTMLEMKDTEIIAADGLGQNDITKTVPMVIARRKPTEFSGGSLGEFQDPITFKTVLEPFRGKPSIENVREIKVENGDGVCIEIEKKDSVHSFFLAFDWRLKTAGDITFNGHIVYLAHEKTKSGKSMVMPDYVYMIEGSRLAQGGFSLNTELNTTLYLERTEDNQYVLEHQGQVASRIEIAGRDWRGVQITRLSTDGKSTKKTQARIVDEKLMFDAEAETRYHISFGG